MPLLISNATIIDPALDEPLEDRSMWIENGRIGAVGRPNEVNAPPSATVIDARGKYVVPGYMNANVHLLGDTRLENVIRYLDRFEDLIAESAQVALKHGLTTVFDTWGPRAALMATRDKINAGQVQGSRIFCAGNIIGFDGPFSPDFFGKTTEIASAPLVNRINAIWVENVGRHLMWLSPEQVAEEVGEYIARGIDFIKYGANEHGQHSGGAFLAFSLEAQAAMVEEAHRRGVTAQSHTMTIEGVRLSVEAGCDLIQHANITGPVPIPDRTLELLAERKTGTVVFPWTERGLDWIMKTVSERERAMWGASDRNARNFVQAGAPMLLANDGSLFAPEMLADPMLANTWCAAPVEDSLINLAFGHFAWFRAMEEKGCPPMELLRAATRNIAVAYGKDKDLGTLEPGKIADVLILDRNPMRGAENFNSISTVIKDGKVVDTDALPVEPILTRPLDAPAAEEAAYITAFRPGTFPSCSR